MKRSVPNVNVQTGFLISPSEGSRMKKKTMVIMMTILLIKNLQ